MNWERQQTKLFWVPIPYTGQSLINLVDWIFDKKKPRQTIQLTDPKTEKPYIVEIIDYLGVFKMDLIPSWLSRTVTNNEATTGSILSYFLKKRLPEFRKVDQVVFYQVKIIE